MPIKIKTSWLYLTFMILFMNVSCQNFENQHQKFLPQTNNYKPAIDTSLWLKETRGIRDILEDRDGNLWFSSPDYIAKYDRRVIKYFSEDDGLQIVGNLHMDVNGIIWVEDGFSIYSYNGERFKSKEILSQVVSNESQKIQFSLWVQRGFNPTDTVYIEPGLYSINQKNTNFYSLPLNADVNNRYLYFPTTKAHFGKDSTIWIGTMEKVFGLKNNSFTSVGREEMGRQKDERQMGIRGIFVDSNGKLWIADNGAGVFVYDGNETLNFTAKHNLDEGDKEGSTLHRAFSIAEDSLGNMWFGTVYSGIWMYNPKTDEFKNYTSDNGVKSDNIWTIYKTRNGELLFGGESPAAVYKFNGIGFDRIY